MAPVAAPPLARALTSLRTAKGWSQKDLATAAGLSPNLLSDYERGRKPLQAEKAERLVAALGLELAAIDQALLFLAEVEALDRSGADPAPGGEAEPALRAEPALPLPLEVGRREIGPLLTHVRILRGWSQKQLAAAGGVPASAISCYERGTKIPSGRTLEKLAAAIGASRPLLARISAHVSATRALLGGAAERAPWIEIARPLVGERQEARRIWSQLAGCPPAERRLRVERDRAAQGWALCELVSALSIKTVVDSPPQALELAKLGLRIAELSPGDESWRSRLMGYAWAHVANCRRVAGDLGSAGEALGRAKRLWPEGASTGPGPLNQHMIGRFESSLLRDAGRPGESIEILDRMLTVAEGRDLLPLLIQKAGCLNLLGRPRGAVSLLRAALRASDAGADPRQVACVRQELVTALVRAGHPRQAERWLPAAREGMLRFGGEIDLVRIDLLEAQVAGRLGRSEVAVAGFTRAREAFLIRGMACDAAYASLDLAAELVKRGELAAAREAARGAVEVFDSRGVPHQAQRALGVLREISGR